MGANGKQYEHICVPCEPMENNRKTNVFHGNQRKTLGKHVFSVGTYGTH